jgi:hypothetical protein
LGYDQEGVGKDFYPQVFVFDYNDVGSGWRKLYKADESEYYYNEDQVDFSVVIYGIAATYTTVFNACLEKHPEYSDHRFVHMPFFIANSYGGADNRSNEIFCDSRK